MFDQLVQSYRESGPVGAWRKAISVLYKRGIRPFLPSSRHFEYAGVPVALEQRWGDQFVPTDWKPDGLVDRPRYEEALVRGLNATVRKGDRVVVVGGGVGATATIAALLVGEAGSVVCFEAGGRGVRAVRRTAVLNGVSGRLEVHHAAVGPAIAVYGPKWRRRSLAPSELPPCDVLELDCEGAEASILSEMLIEPRAILVETHGVYGAPTSLIRSLLADRGYAVEDAGVAEPDLGSLCEEHDIRVLVAQLDGGPGARG